MADEATCQIDGFTLDSVVRPGSVGDLGDVVRQAASTGRAVYPLGGRTALTLGRPPSKPGVGVDLRGLTRVIDFPARDMTITVEAGITVAGLQALLRTENQQLPVDVPDADVATLGGIIAVNASGSRRYGLGTLRDFVIGITVVNDEGVPTKAGGRVVKNVAGYDLNKLHVGALGTLGVISQVTLKVKPLAESRALAVIGCPLASLPEVLSLAHASKTRPVSFDMLNAAAARRLPASARPDSPWLVLLGFEDNRDAVAWQVRQIREEVRPLPGLSVAVLEAEESLPVWKSLADLPAFAGAEFVARLTLLPSRVAEGCRDIAAARPEAELIAHAGDGVVLVAVSAAAGPGGLTADQAATILEPWRRFAVRTHGNLTVPRCPAAWKTNIPVWGDPRADGWLMRAVKSRLDPNAVFNPGRYAADI